MDTVPVVVAPSKHWESLFGSVNPSIELCDVAEVILPDRRRKPFKTVAQVASLLFEIVALRGHVILLSFHGSRPVRR